MRLPAATLRRPARADKGPSCPGGPLPIRPISPWAAAGLLGFSIASSYAARPMITDDARIVDAQACQIESWVKLNRESTEYWAQPACNFTGNLELTFGGARTRDDSGIHTTDVVLQGKTMFKSLEHGGWAWGLALGNIRHPASHTDRRGIGDLYANAPASFSFRDDRLVVHTNLGWLHDSRIEQQRLTWGVGSETELSGNTWLIAETFGQNQGRPFYQAGFRHWIVPERVQIDTTYGNRAGSSTQERWFSIGLRLLSPPFLP